MTIQSELDRPLPAKTLQLNSNCPGGVPTLKSERRFRAWTGLPPRRVCLSNSSRDGILGENATRPGSRFPLEA